MKERVADVYNAVTSKPAQRTLVYTVLLAFGAAVLYGGAIVAYVLFYHNYLPDQIKTIPVHLQYGYESNPYGMAELSRANLKNQQEYDINVALTMPRSPANLDRGNFMVELLLLDTGGSPFYPSGLLSRADFLNGKPVLVASSRPAVLPYRTRLVSLASELLLVGYKLLFPSAEKTTLVVPMAERLSFARSSRLPSSLLLDVKAGQSLLTYSAQVVFVARLQGLRWLMYNWRITSFVVLTTLFWATEVLFMLLAFVAFGLFARQATVKTEKVKKEDPSEAPAIKQESREEHGSSSVKTLPSSSERGISWTMATGSQVDEQDGYEEGREENGAGSRDGRQSEARVVRRRTSQRFEEDG